MSSAESWNMYYYTSVYENEQNEGRINQMETPRAQVSICSSEVSNVHPVPFPGHGESFISNGDYITYLSSWFAHTPHNVRCMHSICNIQRRSLTIQDLISEPLRWHQTKLFSSVQQGLYPGPRV